MTKSIYNFDQLFESPLPFHKRARELRFLDGTPEFKKFLEATYKIKIKRLWLMGWGYNNLNFVVTPLTGDPFLVRVSQHRRNIEDVDFEIKTQHYLATKGLLVRDTIPTAGGAVYIRSLKGRFLGAFTYLEGMQPAGYEKSHVISSGALLRQLHQASQGIETVINPKAIKAHSLSLAAHWDYVKRSFEQNWDKIASGTADKVRLTQFQVLVSKVSQRIEQTIEADDSLRSTKNFVHNDYNPMNIIFRGGKAAGVIDFERVGFGSWQWDVARAAAQWSFYANDHGPTQLAEWFIQGYSQTMSTYLVALGYLERISECFVYYQKYDNEEHWIKETTYFLGRFRELLSG